PRRGGPTAAAPRRARARNAAAAAARHRDHARTRGHASPGDRLAARRQHRDCAMASLDGPARLETNPRATCWRHHMKTLRELLRDADPLASEVRGAYDRRGIRSAVLNAPRVAERPPQRRAVVVAIAAVVLTGIGA